MTDDNKEGQLSIVKTIDVEQIAQIIQSEAQLFKQLQNICQLVISSRG